MKYIFNKTGFRWKFQNTPDTNQIIRSVYHLQYFRRLISLYILKFYGERISKFSDRRVIGRYQSHKMHGPEILIYRKRKKIYVLKTFTTDKVEEEYDVIKSLARKCSNYIHIPKNKFVKINGQKCLLSYFVPCTKAISVADLQDITMTITGMFEVAQRKNILIGFSHGDLSVYNCYISQNIGVPVIIDFEECGFRPVGFDYYYYLLSSLNNSYRFFWKTLPRSLKIRFTKNQLHTYLSEQTLDINIDQQMMAIFEDSQIQHLLN